MDERSGAVVGHWAEGSGVQLGVSLTMEMRLERGQVGERVYCEESPFRCEHRLP